MHSDEERKKQKGTDSSGMDIGEVAELTRKLKEEVERTNQYSQSVGWGKGSAPEVTKLNEDNQTNDQLEKLYQLLKGKGKGETRTCYICGKAGHLAKDCWQGKGKSKGKGFFKGGKFGKGRKGKGKYGKGEGCYNCGQ